MLTVFRVMVRYRMGFLCRELNSGLDLERVISYHWTTQEGALSSVISLGCFDQPSFGLWARRASSAPQWLGGVIGWFRSTSSGLVSMHPLHYNGWFRPTSSNTASMRPHTATTCFDKCPSVAHICHSLHCVPINHINDFLPCGNLLSLIQLIA